MKEGDDQVTEKPSYFSIIYSNVRYDNRLTDSEKLLYAEITSLTQANGTCWATNKYFAELYGVHEKTISKRISNLKKFGYIEVLMKYKNGSKEVDKRIIKIDVTPPHANATTYEQNHSYPPRANATTPPRANATENSTSKSNNTSTNSIKDIVPFGEIIEYLNFRTGKDFRVTPSVRTIINARYEEGFKLQDFKDVIDKKCIEWINDSKMSKYLQPSTLFSNKFQNYLNQEIIQEKQKSSNGFADMLRDME